MDWKTLNETMVAANAKGKELTGYVVISPECMKPEYRNKQARTYFFSSKNKMWQPNMSSCSIWADCLDGEKGIKLSEYINSGDWTIESCGLMFFTLVETFERESSVSTYNTLNEAIAAMRGYMAEALGVTVDKLDEEIEDKGEDEAELQEMSAWANSCGMMNGNGDWSIHPMLTDGFEWF